MKFESKYGIGEVCIYNPNPKRGMSDAMVKILGVKFVVDSSPLYICEHSCNGGVFRTEICESMLEGDPDFNQETGYPDDIG